MNTARLTGAFRPNASFRGVTIVFLLTTVIAASEASLFFGHLRYTIWTYFALLFALSLAPLYFEVETPIFQAFALIPVFRLVNLSMPVFFELTLFWFPLIYGPLIPVFVYFGWRASVDDSDGRPAVVDDRERTTGETGEVGYGLPWWLGGNRGGKFRWVLRRVRAFLAPPEEDLSLSRSILYWSLRAVVVAALPVVGIAVLVSLFVLTAYLAEINYSLITPVPLVPSLDFYHLAALAVIMIGVVGFVEELLFRGVLQNVLERRLGLVPGLLLASGIFGLMHSAYGVPMGIAFAGGVGVLFGVLYDATDSLVLVAAMHGLMNVFLFGIIPLTGTSPVDLLRATVTGELQRAGMGWVVDVIPLLDVRLLAGVL